MNHVAYVIEYITCEGVMPKPGSGVRPPGWAGAGRTRATMKTLLLCGKPEELVEQPDRAGNIDM